MDIKSRIEVILELCEKHGINVYDACREAKVPKDTVTNWKRKNPKPFETEDKILAAINKMVAEKAEGLTPVS